MKGAADITSEILPLSGEIIKIRGNTAFVIMPEKAQGGPVPWIWYAPTLFSDPYPGDLEIWMFKRFTAGGIAIAGIDVGESYGSPTGRKAFSQLYNYLVDKRGFAEKACLLARSRGGLMLYNWAVENPESVACIAGIYPVCNIASYPGLDKACGSYGMTEQGMARVLRKHNPIDRTDPLAQAGVPVYHIHGDSDLTVPLEDNSRKLVDAYKVAGGCATLRVIEGGGHDGNDHWFKHEGLTRFLMKHARRK